MSVVEKNWNKIELIDLHEAIHVEFFVDQSNKVWLNIDGKCAVRIGRVDNLTIEDKRTKNPT